MQNSVYIITNLHLDFIFFYTHNSIMHKILPILFLVLILTIGLMLSPLRTPIIASNPLLVEAVYKLGLSGDSTVSCCTEEKVLTQSGEFDEYANIAVFNNRTVDYPKTSLASTLNSYTETNQAVLGTTNAAGEEKWIEVSLDQQMLRAWEGNRIVMEFPISSGKWAPTPKGTFYIWYKTRSQKMEGGSKELGTYYNLPNVPHNMFFYKGYAIHGAYWHNNFGQPMSHGCVNSPLDKVGALFEWTGPIVPEGKWVVRASDDNPGTKVFVH